MRLFAADLHIHSCLSPCAELDMTPRRIVERAARAGLDMIAIADHNSAENLGAALNVARARGIALLPAMEITSSEEAHVLAIFGSLDGALRVQEAIYGGLPEQAKADPLSQVVVNEEDEVMGFNRRLLIGAASLGLGELIDEIHAAGGLAIPSHIDRGAFSLSSQFGFIPDGMAFDAFEAVDVEAAALLASGYPGVPLICSSDAHQPEDIGRRRTVVAAEGATFEELAMALKGLGGRHVKCG